MPYEEIEALAASYPPQLPSALLEFASERRMRQESEVLELAAAAAELSVDSIINLGLEPNPNSLLLEAVERSGSKIEHSFFKGFGDLPEQVRQGHLNNIKGKYFEILTVDKLNDGESVGEVGKLLPGHVAELADSQNQAGWDVQIKDEYGEPVRFLQAKATTYLGPVKDALTKSSDIPVIVPADFPAETAEMDGKIIGTDITNESLREVTDSQVNELGESTLADFIDKGAEIGFDMIPILPAFVITVTEGHAVLTGSATLQSSLQRGAERLGRATAYGALQIGLPTVIGPAAIPTVMAARIAERRFGHQMAMGDYLRSKTEEIMSFTGQSA